MVSSVNRALKLTLKGSASYDSETDLNATWRVDGDFYGGATLGAVARTPLRSYARSTTYLSSELVIEPYALIAGAHYEFSFSVVSPDAEDAGRAAIILYVSRPPSSGVLDSSPRTGSALTTRFTLTTRLWVADELPLTYRFEDDDGDIIRTAAASPTATGIILAAGHAPNCVQINQ